MSGSKYLTIEACGVNRALLNMDGTVIPSPAVPYYSSLPPIIFYYFNLFAVELRIKIWKHAVDNIQPHLVYSVPKEPGNAIPGVLHACRLSREVAMEKYYRCEVNRPWGSEYYAYFVNYDIDILLLDVPIGLGPQALRMVTEMTGSSYPLCYYQIEQWTPLDVSRINRLVVGTLYWRWLCGNVHRDNSFLETISYHFPRLVQIMFELRATNEPDLSDSRRVILNRVSDIEPCLVNMLSSDRMMTEFPYCLTVFPKAVYVIPEASDNDSNSGVIVGNAGNISEVSDDEGDSYDSDDLGSGEIVLTFAEEDDTVYEEHLDDDENSGSSEVGLSFAEEDDIVYEEGLDDDENFDYLKGFTFDNEAFGDEREADYA